MEFLPVFLNEVISKLNKNQKEEVDVIESLVNTNEENKESTKEKLFRFIEKQKPENCLNFILGCIEHAANVRPKERESIFFLLSSIFNKFHLNFEKTNSFALLTSMCQVRNILPSDKYTKKTCF